MIDPLTDEQIAGQVGALVGYTDYKVIMARRKTGRFVDSGIALGASESGNYATWQFHVENGNVRYYWEHCHMNNYAKAVRDYTKRI